MRHPAIFLAHGAPPLLDDELWMRQLAAWAKALPRPRSILMLSAHWEQAPATLSATTPALVLPMLWWKTGDMPPPLAWLGAALVVAGSGMIFAA
mgnify:CR=1 FL=1